MGWTYTHKPKGEDIKQFFIDHGVLSWSADSAFEYKVLESATVALKTFYAAIERTNKATGERQVWAAVILINYANQDRHNFGYKDMDESCGPNETDCPARILDLLTPTDSQYANDWRARCRATIAKRQDAQKLCAGMLVRSHGKQYKIIEKIGARGFVVTDETGTRYRMTAANARNAEVIDRAPAARPPTEETRPNTTASLF